MPIYMQFVQKVFIVKHDPVVLEKSPGIAFVASHNGISQVEAEQMKYPGYG
jgi:hypothetical protein